MFKHFKVSPPRGKKRRLKGCAPEEFGAEDADDEHSMTTVDPGDPAEDCSIENVFPTDDYSSELTMDCSLEVFAADSENTGQCDDPGGLSTDCSLEAVAGSADTGQRKDPNEPT